MVLNIDKISSFLFNDIWFFLYLCWKLMSVKHVKIAVTHRSVADKSIAILNVLL